MKVGDLVRIHSHYKLEGCTGVVTRIMGVTSGVRARYVVTLTDGYSTWFYNNEIRMVA